MPQLESLPDFLSRQSLDLQQLEDDQKSRLEEEFTTQKVKQAIQEADEVCALGPSGQTIAFF
jgi:hypothetical protein